MVRQIEKVVSFHTEIKGKPQVILLSPEMLDENRLFASQQQVDRSKIEKAVAFHEGTNRYRSDRPSVYPFMMNDRLCFLIGDGHHRTAEAICRGLGMQAGLDDYFGELADKIVGSPQAAIRFAKYGIYGIWPFASFLEEYRRKKPEAL